MSNTLFEVPVSLSYQDTNLTKESVNAIPASASNTEVKAQPLKSVETTASSV